MTSGFCSALLSILPLGYAGSLISKSVTSAYYAAARC